MAKASVLLMVGTALMLAACGEKAPTGQVVASVNGTEVTSQELNAELATVQVPQGADRKAVERAVLQRVIDRKLLAEEAKRGDLDASADYVTQKLRLDETLLAQQYIQQRAKAVTQPSDSDLQKFMADNPNVFANREQLLVDQIRMAPTNDQSLVTALRDIHTQDGVAAALKAKGIDFQRGGTTIDTAGLPPEVTKQIGSLPAGEPFVLPGQGVIYINTIVDRKKVPVPMDRARQLATNGWREQNFRKTITDKVAELRKTAKIEYQPGFAPPPAKPGAVGATAGGAAGAR